MRVRLSPPAADQRYAAQMNGTPAHTQPDGTELARVPGFREYLAVYPVDGKGRLFEAYRDMRMEQIGFARTDGLAEDAGNQLNTRPAARTITRPDGKVVQRTPDGELLVEDVHDLALLRKEALDFLGEGRWIIDDKTGEKAFKLQQAKDYAASGESTVFFFSTKDEADAALGEMVRESKKDAALLDALGSEPPKMVALFFDALGRIGRARGEE